MSATDTCYFLRQFRLKRRMKQREINKLKKSFAEYVDREAVKQGIPIPIHETETRMILEALCGPMGRVMP